MNQRLVAIAVWSLALLFALACAAFAWRATRLAAAPAAAVVDPAVAPGAALWASACARCHAPAEFAPALAGADRVAEVARLLHKLDDHGPLEFSEDLLVVQWLASLAPATVEAPPAPEADDGEAEDFTL
jgi:mono/diheme cytochrome c family protein